MDTNKTQNIGLLLDAAKFTKFLVMEYSKGAKSYFFNFFLNFLKFWYQKMSHIFLITREKFYDQKVFPWEDSIENVTSYGNVTIIKLTQ